MDFKDAIKQFSKKAASIKDTLQTEEATKMSLIIPMFQLLGYDVFDPSEFCPEFTADVGVKKKEKVDYAIMRDGKPIILIECKPCSEDLTKHAAQLFRYFTTTTAQFGILTNGIVYRFYTDIEKTNIMDVDPFMELNILKLKDTNISELYKFHKDNFNYDEIFNTASELKYTSLIKAVLEDEFNSPSADFVKYIISSFHDGTKTQKVIDTYTPLVKKALNSVINDIVNEKLSSALDTTTEEATKNDTPEPQTKIITTDEELDGFNIVKAILAEIIDINRVAYRDTERYFGIIIDNNKLRPVCRLALDGRQKKLMLPDESKKYQSYNIDSISDLYKYKKELQTIAKRYL